MTATFVLGFIAGLATAALAESRATRSEVTK